MNEQSKKKAILSAVFTGVFLVYTLIVKFVDVQPIGPKKSEVGLATINAAMLFDAEYNMVWYSVTEVLGILAILVAGCFGLLGLMQLIKGKSLKAVDPDIYVLGGFYALVIVMYAVFEIVVVNYRPVILEEGLEASYPSSHTMLVICIMATAIMQIKNRIQKPVLCKVLCIVCRLMIVVMVLGRLISGVHWLTDILGGVLISVALVMFYSTAISVERR